MLHDDSHGAFGKAVAEKVDCAGRAWGNDDCAVATKEDKQEQTRPEYRSNPLAYYLQANGTETERPFQCSENDKILRFFNRLWREIGPCWHRVQRGGGLDRHLREFRQEPPSGRERVADALPMTRQ